MFAQKIIGKIVDKSTSYPVANATVYINNSQFSSVSNAAGIFTISKPSGIAELIITHVSYKKSTVNVALTYDTLIVVLEPAIASLNDVVINVKNKDNWKKWGTLFTEYFIGSENNQMDCILLNPDAVRFHYNKQSMTLRAFSKQSLMIENRTLGYLLHIDLDSFVYNFKSGSFVYGMSKHFEHLTPINKQKERLYAANRLVAYKGSRMHFFRSLFDTSLEQQGFKLFKYSATLNYEKLRVESEILKLNGSENQHETVAKGFIDLARFHHDTAKYFTSVLTSPTYLSPKLLPVNLKNRWRRTNDGNAGFFFSNDTILIQFNETGDDDLPYKQLLRIASFKSLEMNTEEFESSSSAAKWQSLMYMPVDSVVYFNKTGFVYNNSQLFNEGYFAEQRVAFEQPWDYDPALDIKILTGKNYKKEIDTRDIIDSSLQAIASKNNSSEIYLHLDKTVYDHNENIWFAAYVLKSPVNMSEQSSLFVFLRNDDTQTKVSSAEFVLQSGLGNGYMFIPDSIPAGNYSLIAYTNNFPQEKNPGFFQQPIVIRPYAQSYRITYGEIADRIKNDSIYLTLKVRKDKGLYPVGTAVNYKIFADHVLFVAGKTIINDYGELLPKGMLLKTIAGKKLIVTTELRTKDETVNIRTELTVKLNRVRITFFPEGGDLVAGLPSRLVYEVKDLNSIPRSVKFLLKENGDVIREFSTDINGTGAIIFQPVFHSSYTIQILNDSLMLDDFKFPPILDHGLTLHVEDGVVDQKLKFLINTTDTGVIHLMLHNYSNNYFFQTIDLKEQRNEFSIGVNDLPAGISTLTIFDNSGNPVAERAVYKSSTAKTFLKIQTDSSEYHTRSKVKIKVRVTDIAGLPVATRFSLACILNSRLDSTKFQDIVPFSLLHQYAHKIISKRPSYYNIYSRNNIETFLLTACWTRYKWHSIQTDAPITYQRITTDQRGKVFYFGRKLKTPVNIYLFTSKGLTTIATDSTGSFIIPPLMRTTQPDEQVNLLIGADDKKNYSVVLENDNEWLQKKLAVSDFPEVSQMIKNVDPEETAEPFRKILATVEIKGRKNVEDFLSGPGVFQSTDCRDYVCMYNILNCTNHRSGTKPVNGNRYYYKGMSQMVTYRGCESEEKTKPPVLMQFNGRYYSKEFYVADYEKFNPDQPENYTTVYWNPMITTDENGEASVTFFTNDLAGRFIIVAEGVTADDEVSGKVMFRVR